MGVSLAVTVLVNAGVAVSSLQIAPEGLLPSTFIKKLCMGTRQENLLFDIRG